MFDFKKMFENSKKAAKIGGAATIGFGNMSNDALAANAMSPENGNKTTIEASAPTNKETSPDNYNNPKEFINQRKLDVAKEALEGMINGGAPFLMKDNSKLLAIPSEISYLSPNKDAIGINLKVYDLSTIATNSLSEYTSYTIIFESKSSLEELKQKIEKGDLNIESGSLKVRDNLMSANVNLVNLYSLLREKMNPKDIQAILEKANPQLSTELLVKVLELQNDSTKQNLADIEMLKSPVVAQN